MELIKVSFSMINKNMNPKLNNLKCKLRNNQRKIKKDRIRFNHKQQRKKAKVR